MTTGSWPTNCFDTNMSAYSNKQDEISIENKVVYYGVHMSSYPVVDENVYENYCMKAILV